MVNNKTVAISNCQSSSDQDKVYQHLCRINGQIDGVVKMYTDGRECIDIVRQVVAVRNSLGRVARELLSGEANRCSREKRYDDLEIILKEIFR